MHDYGYPREALTEETGFWPFHLIVSAKPRLVVFLVNVVGFCVIILHLRRQRVARKGQSLLGMVLRALS